MKSLSGNQIQDLKELYVSIYKSDDQEISETTANLGGLDKKNMEAMKGEKKDITKEKKDEKIEKEGKKERRTNYYKSSWWGNYKNISRQFKL